MLGLFFLDMNDLEQVIRSTYVMIATQTKYLVKSTKNRFYNHPMCNEMVTQYLNRSPQERMVEWNGFGKHKYEILQETFIYLLVDHVCYCYYYPS